MVLPVLVLPAGSILVLTVLLIPALPGVFSPRV
jgi:hypothetical protein